jgi:peptide/nickel transport system substrate-binding protein
MTSKSLRVLGMSVAAASSLFVAACGSSSNSDTGSSSSGASTAKSAAPTGGKQGGTLKQLGSGDVDYLDPGHTYYTGGYQVAFAIGRPLYGFKPGQADPVPDVAEGPPEIAADNKSITIKIKPGIKFAPPVNRAVTSKDIKYAIDRTFSANVGGQYSTAYFGAIKGAPTKPTKGVKSLAGTTTPDDQTLKIELTRAEAPGVAAALVMPITIPVPESYAKEFDAKSPSTYNTHVVASGAYMVANDASGKLTGYKPGKSIKLIRNPNWDKATDFKPAFLDEIDMKTNGADASVDAQQILKGQSLVQDANPPAAELKLAVQNYKGQFGTVPAGGYRYFPLNTTIKPFDNLNVRKAILAGFDREAALKARGGKFTGEVASHFLPPDFPGFDEAGGRAGTGVDFLKNPRGDMALAAKYMKAAGYPSGKYTGKETFLMVGATADPVKSQSEVAQAQLQKLGFNIKLRLVPQDAVYTEYCQVPKKKVAICGGSGWFKDFQDPQSMLEPTFKGSNISPDGGNNNLAQLNDPKIDAAMGKAAVLQGAERLKAYGEIDKMITAAAPAVPFDWDKTTILWSKNVQGVINDYYTTADFSWMSLK